MRRWQRFTRWTMTGLVPLALISGLYYHSKLPVSVVPPNRPVFTEVMAGRNKAMLTLTDGRTLALGDATHGELTRQGFTQIMQSGEGALIYRTGKATPAYGGYNVITTPRGGQYSVILSDGTRAWLNNASRLRYPVSFNGRERRVELSGEVYFSIARCAGRPFYIMVGGDAGYYPTTEMEASGTELDVMAYPDEGVCKVILPGGSVKLKNGGTGLLVTDADPGQAAAWKNGVFSFQGASLQEIMRQAARWYDVDVIFKDSIDQRFTCKIPRQVSMSALLRMLEATGSVHFKLEGRTVIVMQ
ncbi:MAG TPA: FecR domain-containing protein [Puia sp.]|nr:FecR domain-containing protein [Puia sp.]